MKLFARRFKRPRFDCPVCGHDISADRGRCHKCIDRSRLKSSLVAGNSTWIEIGEHIALFVRTAQNGVNHIDVEYLLSPEEAKDLAKRLAAAADDV